jgi:two-component system, response regulator PdtaR
VEDRLPSAPAKRLLIVEDEFLIALMAEDALVAAGIDVVGIARTFEEAVALCGREQPDLVLMDIRLASARDGIEAATEIRRRLNIASLFVSANHDPDTMRRAEPAAPAGWLAKPYTADRLVQAARTALEIPA